MNSVGHSECCRRRRNVAVPAPRAIRGMVSDPDYQISRDRCGPEIARPRSVSGALHTKAFGVPEKTLPERLTTPLVKKTLWAIRGSGQGGSPRCRRFGGRGGGLSTATAIMRRVECPGPHTASEGLIPVVLGERWGSVASTSALLIKSENAQPDGILMHFPIVFHGWP